MVLEYLEEGGSGLEEIRIDGASWRVIVITSGLSETVQCTRFGAVQKQSNIVYSTLTYKKSIQVTRNDQRHCES